MADPSFFHGWLSSGPLEKHDENENPWDVGVGDCLFGGDGKQKKRSKIEHGPHGLGYGLIFYNLPKLGEMIQFEASN